MGTDHRINAVMVSAALLGAVLLSSCSHGSYEKIAAVETTEIAIQQESPTNEITLDGVQAETPENTDV